MTDNNFAELISNDKITDFNEKFKELTMQKVSAELQQQYTTNISNLLNPSEEL